MKDCFFPFFVLFLLFFRKEVAVDSMKQYIIPVQGLKEGEYSYHFEIDEKFFKHFEYSEVKYGNLEVDVELEKRTRMLVFTFNIKGTVHVMCDRCLDMFDLYVSNEMFLYVKFGESQYEESASTLIIPEESGNLDIAHYIYEYIILAIPYKRVHENIEACNQDVVSKLSTNKEQNQSNTIDPRLEKLNYLYKNNN